MLYITPADQVIKSSKFAFDTAPAAGTKPANFQSLQSYIINRVQSGDVQSALKRLNFLNPQLRQQLIMSLPPNIKSQLGTMQQTPTPEAPRQSPFTSPQSMSPSATPANDAQMTPNPQDLKKRQRELARIIRATPEYQEYEQITQQIGTTQTNAAPAQTPSPAAPPASPSSPVWGTPSAPGSSLSNQVGNWAGRALKAPGRALREMGRGFTGAESALPVLTAAHGSSARFVG